MTDTGSSTSESNQTPLLSRYHESNCENREEHTNPPSTQLSERQIIALILLLIATFDIGYELIAPAQTRVIESIYCRQYYEQHNISLIGGDGRGGVDEKWCKVPIVQGELAMLKGWQITLDSIGSKYPRI